MDLSGRPRLRPPSPHYGDTGQSSRTSRSRADHDWTPLRTPLSPRQTCRSSAYQTASKPDAWAIERVVDRPTAAEDSANTDSRRTPAYPPLATGSRAHVLRTRPPSPTADGRVSSRTHPRRSTPAQPRLVKIDADAVDPPFFSTASAAQRLTAAAAYTAIRRSAVMPKDASSLACQTRRSATSWAASRLTPRRSTSRFSRPPQGEGFPLRPTTPSAPVSFLLPGCRGSRRSRLASCHPPPGLLCSRRTRDKLRVSPGGER